MFKDRGDQKRASDLLELFIAGYELLSRYCELNLGLLQEQQVLSTTEPEVFFPGWLMPIIQTLRRLRQKDCHKFKVNLGYIVSTRLFRAS